MANIQNPFENMDPNTLYSIIFLVLTILSTVLYWFFVIHPCQKKGNIYDYGYFECIENKSTVAPTIAPTPAATTPAPTPAATTPAPTIVPTIAPTVPPKEKKLNTACSVDTDCKDSYEAEHEGDTDYLICNKKLDEPGICNVKLKKKCFEKLVYLPVGKYESTSMNQIYTSTPDGAKGEPLKPCNSCNQCINDITKNSHVYITKKEKPYFSGGKLVSGGETLEKISNPKNELSFTSCTKCIDDPNKICQVGLGFTYPSMSSTCGDGIVCSSDICFYSSACTHSTPTSITPTTSRVWHPSTRTVA